MMVVECTRPAGCKAHSRTSLVSVLRLCAGFPCRCSVESSHQVTDGEQGEGAQSAPQPRGIS